MQHRRNIIISVSILAAALILAVCLKGTGIGMIFPEKAKTQASGGLSSGITTEDSSDKTGRSIPDAYTAVDETVQEKTQSTGKQHSEETAVMPAAVPEGSASREGKPEAQESGLLVERLKCAADSEQIVIVTSKAMNSVAATIQAFEKDDGKWQPAFGPYPGVVGMNGFTENKVEGDKKSPEGVYSLGLCFGKYPNPGTAMSYRQTTENDYWVDDMESPLYNTWQTGPADGRWKSAETLRLTENVYNYAVVINYNTKERIPGKGSAIFFHVWRGPNIGTLGCTAMSQENLLNIIRWLNPSKKPIIIQGTEEWVQGL